MDAGANTASRTLWLLLSVVFIFATVCARDASAQPSSFQSPSSAPPYTRVSEPSTTPSAPAIGDSDAGAAPLCDECTDANAPPIDALPYREAEVVLDATVLASTIVRTIRDDTGKPGYEVRRISARVNDALKGTAPLHHVVCYLAFLEVSDAVRAPNRRRLVFLERDRHRTAHCAWIAIENADFPYSPCLAEKARAAMNR